MSIKADAYNARGLTSGKITADTITELTRHWQSCNDLVSDGMLGPNTIASIRGQSSVTSVMSRALAIATSELGCGETTGNNQGEAITRYRRNDGTGLLPTVGPWCASFVSYCYMQAITELGAWSVGFRSSRGARRLGKLMPYRVDVPIPGAIIVWSRGAVGGWKGHTGIIETYDPVTDTCTVLEGNKGHFPSVVKRYWYNEGDWRVRLLGIHTL